VTSGRHVFPVDHLTRRLHSKQIILTGQRRVDEQDVKSVLVRQAGKLDNEYLTKRATKAQVLALLQVIQAT